LNGCPEYTFSTIRDDPDFRTWVETVAGQWLALLEPSPDDSRDRYPDLKRVAPTSVCRCVRFIIW